MEGPPSEGKSFLSSGSRISTHKVFSRFPGTDMPVETGSKPVPEDSISIKTKKNTSNSVFYLKHKCISGKGMEFTLINVDSLQCVPKDDMSIIWDWHGRKPHRSKRILAPISYLNLISRQPRDNLSVLAGVQFNETMAIRRPNSQITDKNGTKNARVYKKIFIDWWQLLPEEYLLSYNFWKDVNVAGTRSNTSCPFQRLCVTFHDFL